MKRFLIFLIFLPSAYIYATEEETIRQLLETCSRQGSNNNNHEIQLQHTQRTPLSSILKIWERFKERQSQPLRHEDIPPIEPDI